MIDPSDVDATLQAVLFQLYRENVYGALEMVQRAHAAHPDARYEEQARRIRSWLTHLESREAYVAAQEEQYRRLRWRTSLKLLERRLRTFLGRRTRKMVERRRRDPEFRELARTIEEIGPRRVLDAGSGEGGIAMAIATLWPTVQVEGVEVSPTNVRLARGLNRCPNASFRHGFAEEVHRYFAPDTFDVAYSFAVLEHVRDVEATVESILSVVRPGGAFCFAVPMREFRVVARIPDYQPVHGYADHCRVFTEEELRRRFGTYEGFRLVKTTSAWKPGEVPDCFEPVEFGSFFVAFRKPR